MSSNTFAIKEVLDFNVSEYSPSGYGDDLFDAEYATSSTISTKADRLPIRGGQGNFKILDLDHSKDCSFIGKLPIVDINALAVKLGVDVTTGAKLAPMKDIKTVGSDNKITLSHQPATGTLRLYILKNERDRGEKQTPGAPATTPNEYSISTSTVTFNATSCPQGTKIIALYDYMSGVNSKNIKITAEDFPKYITITGRGLVDDDQMGQRVPVAFRVHKAKVQPGFELTMESTKATEIDFTADCYTILNSEGKREYVDIIRLDDEAF